MHALPVPSRPARYFIKALTAWPNVLSTGYASWQAAQAAPEEGGSGSSSGGAGAGEASGGGMWRSESQQSVSSSSGGYSGSASGGGNGALGGGGGGRRLGGMLRRRPPGPQALLSEAQDAVWLGYKPTCRPDKEVLGRLAHPRPAGKLGFCGEGEEGFRPCQLPAAKPLA